MRRTLANRLAAVVLAQEAVECGDIALVVRLLEDLEHDLRDETLAPRRRRYRCETCGVDFRWPGELDDHRRFGACSGSRAA